MADSILRLKVESHEYDAKIKRAAEGIQRFAEQVYKSGGAVTELEKDQVAFIKSLGNMETVSKTTTGKLREMETAYKNLSATYHLLQRDQQNDAGGKALRASLDQLKVRINETRTAIKKADSELNDFSQTEKNFSKESFNMNGILSQVGGQMGINTSMLSGLTTGTMGYMAALGALVKVEYEAAKAFKEYNDEMARQQEITTVTTGLTGGDADNMTAAARSISKVYGTDFREVINAANTLMTQFGKTGDEAIQLIRDGMQGMIMGDGGKLLNMIKQYAPSFRDAGIEASQLIAIIQNSEGGLFTDENMNAIVMGIKNIRLMTKATNDALKQIGINGDYITKRLNDGTMTIFEAMGKVSEALQNVQAGGQDAGQVMQHVFGRQGTAAGTNLAKAIATLNTNLEETKNKTGQLGDSFAKLEQANEKLEKAMMKTFEVKGWDEMWNIIETKVISAFADVVDILGDINNAIDSVGYKFEEVFGAGGGVVQYITDFVIALTSPLGLLKEMVKYTKMLTGAGKGDAKSENVKSVSDYYKGVFDKSENKTAAYSEITNKLYRALNREFKKNGKSENYNRLKEIIQIVDDYMNDYLSGFGVTKSTIKPTTKNPNAANDVKEKSIEDIINEQFPDIAQAESVGQSYGEQIMQGIMVGMAEKAQNADVSTLKNLMEVIVKNGVQGIDIPTNEIMETILGYGGDIPDSYWRHLQDAINEKLKEMNIEPIEIDFSTGNVKGKKPDKKEDKEKEKYLSDGLTKLAGGLGGLQSGIQQLGIDLGDGFSDVVNGLQGISTILTSIQSIVSAIEIISSVKFFNNGGVIHAAEGWSGIVPGNSFSGDNIRMGDFALNSGELVLNKFQQQALAGTLENGGMKSVNVTGHLEGETIVLAADRWGKRTGKGELAFWKS